MIYVDTSVLVALILPEGNSAAVARWYGRSRARLVCAHWCVTEFASALSIKCRTGQIDDPQSKAAWQWFERLLANDLVLLPPTPADFHRAAALALDAASALRAGDALHLACAERAGARAIATLDAVQARNALRLKIRQVAFA